MPTSTPTRPHPPWYSPPDSPAPGGPGWRIREPGPAPEPIIGLGDSRPADTASRRARRHLGRIAYGVFAALTALLAATALGFVVERGLDAPHSIGQPANVAAYGLITSQAGRAQTVVAAAVEAMESLGATQVISGMYGSDGRARLLLVVAKARAPVPSGTQLLQAVSARAGWSYPAATVAERTEDGVDYACALGAGATAVTLCVWGDVDVMGAIVDNTASLAAAISDAASARSAAEH